MAFYVTRGAPKSGGRSARWDFRVNGLLVATIQKDQDGWAATPVDGADWGPRGCRLKPECVHRTIVAWRAYRFDRIYPDLAYQTLQDPTIAPSYPITPPTECRMFGDCYDPAEVRLDGLWFCQFHADCWTADPDDDPDDDAEE